MSDLTWDAPTTEEVLINLFVALLTTPVQVNGQGVYPTTAGTRVYAPRDWPTVTGDYPDILISTPREGKENAGRGRVNFTTTTTLRLLVRADNPADASDGSAGELQATLATIKRQIERTIIGAPALMQIIQQVASVRSEYGYNSSGEKHMGELGMEFDVEYFQNAWAFNLPTPVTVTEVSVATSAQDLGTAASADHVAPGLDITLPT